MEKPIQRGRRVCGIVTYFTRLYEEEKKKKERKKRGKKLPAISTRSWILCSEQNIVRARDDNISGKWVNGVVIYIYIYIFRKFERKLPSISVEIGFEKKRPWENLFYGGIGKKKKKKLFDRTKWDGTISRECKLELLFNYFLVYSCVL